MSEAVIQTRRRRGWWRRLRRQYRKQRESNRGRIAIKPWNGLILVTALLGFDQATKHILTTQEWAWHEQGEAWLTIAILALFILAPLTLLPIIRLPLLFLMSGTFGNALSETLHDRIANPLVTQYDRWQVAFNAADAYLITGVMLAAWLLTRPRRHAR